VNRIALFVCGSIVGAAAAITTVGIALRSTSPKGVATISDLKAGDITWREGLTHSLENVGNSEVHVLSIELKR
jgi:hypothetical protein